MRVREKFELGGVTVLACAGCEPGHDVVGKTFRLVRGDEVRQILAVSGERQMLDQKAALDQKAFETHDKVLLSREEVISGEWQLIGD